MFNAPPAINRKFYLSRGQKLGLFVALVLLVILALVSGIVAIATLVAIITRNSRDNNIVPSMVAAAICAASSFGLFKLVPVFRRPVDFAPRFGNIPPGAYGHPFDVRLLRKTMGPAFNGSGVVQFFPDHLIVDGHREQSSYVQIGIFASVTVLPALLIGLLLGIIPAALLAKYVGRKKLIQPIPYQAIGSIRLDGNMVTIECPNLSPGKTVFYVASVDGPRLSGEIHSRFAALMQGVAAGVR